MRTDAIDNIPRGDGRAERLDGRPALSFSDIGYSDFRSIRNSLAPISLELPTIQLFDSGIRRGIADRSSQPSTDAQNLLRERIATDYASPAMAGRRERFLQDMDRFNERARDGGLSAHEVSETYRQIERLLQPGPGARLPREVRLALASQVMHNAAVPTDVRQNENSCSVASLEVRTYTRQPSAAAALVADVATTGAFTTRDGITIRLDGHSLTPSRVGTVALSQEASQRSFASQIFQVTAGNISNALDPNFRDLRYVQRPPMRQRDSGEELVDAGSGEVQHHWPGAAAYPNGLIRVGESITGNRDEAQAYLVNSERRGRTSAQANHFDNPDQLGNRLEELNRRGQLPAIVFVHANSDLFPQRSSNIPGDPFSDGHYITVTGYDPATRTVRYDDQYSADADRRIRPVSLQTLFDATHVVRANQWLDRLEAGRATMSQAEFVRNLETLGRTYAARWQSVRRDGRIPAPDVEADRVAATARINALARELPQGLRHRVERSLIAPPSASRR